MLKNKKISFDNSSDESQKNTHLEKIKMILK